MAIRDRPKTRERQSRPDAESHRITLMITRRQMISSTIAAAGVAISGAAFGQGISSRGVKAQPRGKPSGRPFLSRITDVAEQARLTQPIIYGAARSQRYSILGGGCWVGCCFVPQA